MALTARDLKRLNECHPHLTALALEASRSVAFMVVEGARSLARQRELFALGKSKTMNSRHLPKLAKGFAEPVSHAVDLAPLVDIDDDGDLDLSWKPEQFEPIAEAMKAAAATLGYAIVWGGDWTSFIDMPHFELDRRTYP